MNRKQKLMAGIAAVIIVLSVGFLVWSLLPAPLVVIPKPDDPATRWMTAYSEISAEHARKQDPFYWATANVNITPSADGQKVTITGKVSAASQLELLKSELAKVEPAVPIEWSVTVGR